MEHQKGKELLDYEEQEGPGKKTGKQRIAFFLEIIPIALLATGVFLRKVNSEYWPMVIFAGGSLAALIYLFFSWYLFKVNEYRLFEVIVSVLTGLFFSLSFLGLFFRFLSWEGGKTMLMVGMYGGLGLFAICAFMFLFYLSDERASRFYQNILARLLVFTAILFSVMPLI